MATISDDKKIAEYKTQIEFMNIVEDCKRLAKTLKDERSSNHLLDVADRVSQISDYYHNITK